MRTLKVAFASTIPADAIPAISAAKTINEKFPQAIDLRLRAGGDFRDFGALDDFINFSKRAHIVIVHLMGDLPDLDKLVEALKPAKVPLMVSAPFFGGNTQTKFTTVYNEDKQKIFFYLNYGGKKNFENLFYYLANRFIGENYVFEAPTKPLWEGIYHPDFDYVPTLTEYMAKKIDSHRVTVGLWFHQSQWQGGNTSFVDAMINEIEAQGANVLPVFFGGSKNPKLGMNGLDWVIDNYFLKDGKPLVDVVISLFSFSLSTCLSGVDALGTLKRLGVPIIKAITTSNTFEEWRDTMQGLSIMDIPANVAMPEFDGTLITVPVASIDYNQTVYSAGTRIIKFEPIPERTKKAVCLAINWGKLRQLSNNQKKVAIIFHNYPPRNDTIGHAFGLDSSVSVMNILQDLKNQGYTLDDLPESSQKLMDTIIAGLTNDRRWASAQELTERSLDKISFQQYEQWFNEVPLDVAAKMEKDWEKRPGKLYTYNGKILVAGIQNGNIFIGLQPPRGYLETSASIYHSPDLSMPHHYYAYYRWIRDIFGANVIMHIGTHGSLEWLPGKSVGLSKSCFPDIAISDLPNIYPYVITNPGEGTQAKRRSYCCIIEHLVPVMHNADSYEELAKLEVQLQDYYHAKTVDSDKLPVLRNIIWENVVAAKLDKDLIITRTVAFASFDDFLEQLHAYINELSDAQIRDGLHILGEAPKDQRLDEFLVTLTRLNNGDVPSLRQSIAELLEFDYEDLLAHRGKLCCDGKTNGDHLKEISALSFELVQKYRLTGFNEEKLAVLTREVLGASNSQIDQCLIYISRFLVPALASTTDELTYTLSGCQGGYVPPGPSGSITRGMADILPTGRNFYSVDPRAVPTPASWEVGVALADVLLERYLKEEGKYPESIGITIWATDTMKTKGDDIAEILYLMGVKPVWERSSGRVIGVEPLPLEVLKRPRIDVTMRISGLFRDTFPVVVNLLDAAVELVAGLKESHDQNFIVKHVDTEVAEEANKGVDAVKAREAACYRIFGDQPGAYGCGVSEVIDSKNWKDQTDLSDVYINWGSYAYTRKTYGLQTPEQFKRCLKKINVTVKNQDSREYDILDGDDWYDSHGGMINAVKTVGGKMPRSYCGDTSDPNRVKVRSTAEETCYVFRSRILNPKYIDGMKRHGYQGAADLSRNVDFIFGWDATVDIVEDWMYEELAKKYVFDQTMQKWLKDVNPYALQNMVERLLEAIERNMWQTSDEMKKELQKLYLSIEGLLESANEK
ncbi:MAG: cobaltochelatase subunit CobN [Candidatus Bathyarchaeota archaeon]|uniref:cobaltochelatase subunit CobN n=1 Tax=Candidatus Bathycorpusculum sp. TaxID=2994959 RepID=UPI00282D79D6|nr:cobaltochelatase subunit CobN [Candidatus Termiticorpusculum sp.]MCL2256658.1 cobaltochelatase subunit CobN [Candidatus Termiticorpusculum sp.]MCL2292803.1 cobaltochelatase subunit CobN [Candidatus Termiticorpusculum sp.]